MQPRSAPRSQTAPRVCLAVLGSIWGLLGASPWLGRARAEAPGAAIPADLGRDEVRCDATGCSLGGCLLLQMERNPVPLLGTARFVIRMAEGMKMRGFQLTGVTPESLMARIGLQNGDIVLAVSTFDLSSPDSTMAAFNHMRSADSETLRFERGGSPLTRVLRFDRRPLNAADCPIQPPAATETEARQPKTSPAPTPSDAETLRALAKDIRCTNNRCTLGRATVDRILASSTLVMRSVRVVPVFKDGQPQGFKLFAIRPGSVFALLGLRNGDFVRSLNGMDLSAPDKALQAYATLRGADEVKLDLERAGVRTVLTYVIKK